MNRSAKRNLSTQTRQKNMIILKRFRLFVTDKILKLGEHSMLYPRNLLALIGIFVIIPALFGIGVGTIQQKRAEKAEIRWMIEMQHQSGKGTKIMRSEDVNVLKFNPNAEQKPNNLKPAFYTIE